MKKSILKSLVFVSFLFTCFLSYAITANNAQTYNIYGNEDLKIGFGLQAAYLTGETRESVYDVDYNRNRWDRKLSELEWNLDDVILVGGVFSFQFYEKFNLNIGYWDKVSSSRGTMDDSDWMGYILWMEENEDGTYSESEIENLRTDYSSSKTSIKKGQMMDINLAYTLTTMNGDWLTSILPEKSLDSSFSIQGLAGYKYDEWKWEAKGGHYLYDLYFSDEYSMGQFEDSVGITYETEMKIPYLGLNLNLQNENKTLNAYCLWSKWVNVKAIDHHLERNMMDKDTFDDGTYWSFGLNLKWDFASNWSINGGYQWEEVKQIRGNAVYQWFDESSEGYLFPYSAGYSHKNSTFSLAVNFKFL